MFTKATKTQARLRLALMGPSGSGKTFTALTFAQALGQRIAVIDTEYGSSQIYADRFSFDVAVLKRHHPRQYITAIAAADEAGYDVLIIDSLSHAWMGREGALELKDQAAKRGGMNDYTAWSVVTPLHNQLLDAIKAAECHVIATLRTKTAYEVDRDERNKTIVRKLGLAPVQRDGVEYEFDIIGDMTTDNTLIITKSRMAALTGRVIEQPDGVVADEIAAWLRDGAPPVDHPAGNGVGTLPDNLEEHAQEQASNGNRVLVEHLKRCRQAEQEVGLEPTPLPAGLKDVAIRDMDAALLQQTIDGIRQRLRQVLAAVWAEEQAQAQQVGGDAPAQVEAQQAADYTGEITGPDDSDTLGAAIRAARARVAARTATLAQDPVQVVGTLHRLDDAGTDKPLTVTLTVGDAQVACHAVGPVKTALLNTWNQGALKPGTGLMMSGKRDGDGHVLVEAWREEIPF